MPLPMPDAFRGNDSYDPDKWGKEFDIESDSEDKIAINTYIAYRKNYYTQAGYRDLQLWEYFKEDFQEWTEKIWGAADKDIRSNFRDYLRGNGVNIIKQRGAIAPRLYEAAQLDQEPVWTEADIKSQQELRSPWNSWRATAVATQPLGREASVDENAAAERARVNAAARHQRDRDHLFGGLPAEATPGEASQPQIRRPVANLPAVDVAGAERADSRALADLAKFYHDDEKKYDGTNFLNHKLIIFYHGCARSGLPEDQWKFGFSDMLKGKAATYFYTTLSGHSYSFDTMVNLLRSHFENNESREEFTRRWHLCTMKHVIADVKNAGKTRRECLEILIAEIEEVALGKYPDMSEKGQLETNGHKREQLLLGAEGIKETKEARFQPMKTWDEFVEQLRNVVTVNEEDYSNSTPAQYYNHVEDQESDDNENYLVDRHYGYPNRGRQGRQYRGQGRQSYQRGSRGMSYRQGRQGNQYRGRGGYRSSFNRPSRSDYPTDQKCYVCGKQGCWSTTHTSEERAAAYNRFKSTGTGPRSHSNYVYFLGNYEGMEDFSIHNDNREEALLQELDWYDIEPYEYDDEQFWADEKLVTELGDVDGLHAAKTLLEQATRYAITGEDIWQETLQTPTTFTTFNLQSRYNHMTFEGILPDTGASGVSTGGLPQFQALQKLMPKLQLDTRSAGDHSIRFGQGDCESIGSVEVPLQFGPVVFHIVPANTPFLLCLQDMDRLRLRLDNLDNCLVQGKLRVPIKRKYGHPWLLIHEPEQFLTEVELRRLHRRFGHPTVLRIQNVLDAAGEEYNLELLQEINKYCHQCQMNGKSPGRFKFTVKDPMDFNYNVFADIMYMKPGDSTSKALVQLVDEATDFIAAAYLGDDEKAKSAKHVLDLIRYIWSHRFIGNPQFYTVDSGNEFKGEFKKGVELEGSILVQMPIEAHHSVGRVESNHSVLRRAINVITADMRLDLTKPKATDDMILQMAVKACNDTIGPKGYIPTLLVFGTYPRTSNNSPPTPSNILRAEAINKAMKAVRAERAKRQISDALGIRNGPSTALTLALPLGSEVKVWRENKGWRGPYKLLFIDSQTVTVLINDKEKRFRSTAVKPYYREDANDDGDVARDLHQNDQVQTSRLQQFEPTLADIDLPADNNDEDISIASDSEGEDVPDPPRRGNRVRRPTRRYDQMYAIVRTDNWLQVVESDDTTSDWLDIDDVIQDVEDTQIEAYLTHKERADYDTAVKLRAEGKITAPGEPFQQSDQAEMDSLIAKGVIKVVEYDPFIHTGRIFKSRMVRTVKGRETDHPFEKSRLVIQAFNDEGKEFILTQSPTLTRVGQRTILSTAPALIWLEEHKHKPVVEAAHMILFCKDVSQAYTASKSKLLREFRSWLPEEQQRFYRTIMVIISMFAQYGIPESGLHWYVTYIRHHIDKLSMEPSTFDPCLLMTKDRNPFGMVGVQVDDTLVLATPDFAAQEDTEFKAAGFEAKPVQVLSDTNPLTFNGCSIYREGTDLIVRPKEPSNPIELIDLQAENRNEKYVEQRARAAYRASVSQPLKLFALSTAAQARDPAESDIIALNEALQWFIDNPKFGIRMRYFHLPDAKLFVFVDASFANLQDLSSQGGYTIMIGTETKTDEDFTIKANLVHASSTKIKRVTRSALASEVYGMADSSDMAIALSTTLNRMMKEHNLPRIPIILCTDSYSLYECIVKLGTTKEKRLMIDIMALRQSYERREIQEIRWINGKDNPADSMTKAKDNGAFETFLRTNKLNIRVEGWVKRQ